VWLQGGHLVRWERTSSLVRLGQTLRWEAHDPNQMLEPPWRTFGTVILELAKFGQSAMISAEKSVSSSPLHKASGSGELCPGGGLRVSVASLTSAVKVRSEPTRES
jgi:hypothetical protein